jgi:hypothetical protein
MSRSHWFIAVLILGLFGWVFAEALSASGMFAFRDGGHYYYPLLQTVRGEWLAGHVPLWSPYENLGTPLAANPTASVFYPGAAILLLPIGFPWAYKLYVMAHLLLAAWAAYRLARHWGASVEAAGLASLSYAFSGNVLIQYANVVFLVGAAWLPLALLAADRMLVERRPGSALAFAVTLALMILGGDPQMAYHAVLLAVVYGLWIWWSEPTSSLSQREREPEISPLPRRSRWRELAQSRPALLVLAGMVAFLLAAAQIFPSLEFSRRSGRVQSSVPRTVYEAAGYLWSGKTPSDPAVRWSDGLTCRRIEPGSHLEDVYQFSVGPWRLTEYLWPNFGGRQFPVHRRWMDAIPAEGRVWTPSLYMGLLPLVLAVVAMRFRPRYGRASWLSWLVVASVLGSFGWYGLGWLVRELRFAAGANLAAGSPLGEPVGGLYWLMTLLLPGYVSFRYPAKLLVLAALGLSLLAAVGWDRGFGTPSKRLRLSLLAFSGVSLIALGLLWSLRSWWQAWLQAAPPNSIFGPLDVAGAATDVTLGFIQTAVVALAAWWLLGRVSSNRRWPQYAALILVAVDLAIANGWMVACAPANLWQSTSKLAATIRQHAAWHGDGQPYRVYRDPGLLSPSWRRQASGRRLAEMVAWDRDTLAPKHNLSDRMTLTEVYGTMMPYDYEYFLRLLKGFSQDRQSNLAGAAAWDVIGARYAILPQGADLAGATQALKRSQKPALPRPEHKAEKDARKKRAPPFLRPEGMDEISLWTSDSLPPRAWIVHRVDVLPPLVDQDIEEIQRRTERVFFEEHRWRNLRESAVVETESAGDGAIGEIQPTPPAPLPQAGEGSRKMSSTGQAGEENRGRLALPPALSRREREKTNDEICRIVRQEPTAIEMSVRLQQPGLVVLCDQFYPGWRVDVDTAGRGRRSLPILRANRVMRGVWLPAGEHWLVYRYQPGSLLTGAVLSAAAWLGLAALAVGRRRRAAAGRL